MTSIIELLFILLSSFGVGLIPFVGPSSLLIAANVSGIDSLSTNLSPLTLFIIGFLVALGVSLAKSVHYIISFFVSKHLSAKKRRRLDAEASKVNRWAFLLLFAAAATPIPDEPVVIPLGLMKYSPAKFFTAFFLGKLVITVPGAFLGKWTSEQFSEWLRPEIMIVLSIVLTIVITYIMLKVDVGKIAENLLKKKTKTPKPNPDSPSTGQA